MNCTVPQSAMGVSDGEVGAVVWIPVGELYLTMFVFTAIISTKTQSREVRVVGEDLPVNSCVRENNHELNVCLSCSS